MMMMMMIIIIIIVIVVVIVVIVALYLNVEAAGSSETSVSAYQRTCHNISEDNHVYSHLYTNIKSYSSKAV